MLGDDGRGNFGIINVRGIAALCRSRSLTVIDGRALLVGLFVHRPEAGIFISQRFGLDLQMIRSSDPGSRNELGRGTHWGSSARCEQRVAVGMVRTFVTKALHSF